jgi:peptidoglycan/LPS O-acetylase OafA/YrhL
MVVIAAVLIVERLGSGQPAVESLADGARWAALFGANYHTILMFAPYWSLAVEEQFYLVYPALLLVVVFVMRDWPLRRKLCGFLLAVIAASYSWSILAPAGAGYQSSLARAWELAVGALVAVATDQLKRIPAPVAAAITWVGGVLLLVVAFTLRLSPTYPGAVAALPVAAAALIIAGGTAAPPRGTEAVLKLAPFRWLGRWSYSLYLWHWPLLVLAAQHWRRTDLATNLGLVALAVVLSACCYFWIENPIRHSALLTRSPLTELAFGAAIVGLCLGLVAVAS